MALLSILNYKNLNMVDLLLKTDISECVKKFSSVDGQLNAPHRFLGSYRLLMHN